MTVLDAILIYPAIFLLGIGVGIVGRSVIVAGVEKLKNLVKS